MDRITQLLQFLQDNPKDPFVRYALALEYLKRNDTATGLQYFEGLVESDPDYVGTYYHLGKLYAALKRKDDALACYQKGMQTAKKLNDQHSLAELQNAHMNLELGLGDD